jgi:hypothetical protein
MTIANIEKRIKELEDGCNEYKCNTIKCQNKAVTNGIRFAIREMVDEMEDKMRAFDIHSDTFGFYEKDWLSLKERLLKLSGGKP